MLVTTESMYVTRENLKLLTRNIMMSIQINSCEVNSGVFISLATFWRSLIIFGTNGTENVIAAVRKQETMLSSLLYVVESAIKPNRGGMMLIEM